MPILCGFMEERRSGKASVDGPLPSDIFLSCSISQSDTEETIAEINSKYDYVIDPHTVLEFVLGVSSPTIRLSHCNGSSREISDALGRAIGYRPTHTRLSGLSDLQERKQEVLG